MRSSRERKRTIYMKNGKKVEISQSNLNILIDSIGSSSAYIHSLSNKDGDAFFGVNIKEINYIK